MSSIYDLLAQGNAKACEIADNTATPAGPDPTGDSSPDAATASGLISSQACLLSRSSCLAGTVAGSNTQVTFANNDVLPTGWQAIRVCGLQFGGGETYTVDWGDGTVDGPVTGVTAHEYAAPGAYTVTVTLNSGGPCDGTVINTYNITVV